MNQLKRVALILGVFFAILFFQVTVVKAENIEICVDENKVEEVYYEYISTGGDFVINDQSVVSVENPEVARIIKKGTSCITWIGSTKVYGNTLSITGLSEGTTKVYLDKPYIGLTLHIEVATVTVTQHQWGSEYRIDIEPTCISDGQKAIFCEKCSKKQESSEIIIPAKGHTSVTDEAVAPTCTVNGKTEGSHCSICGEIIKKQEDVQATGHKYTNYISDDNATCTQDGTKTAICDNGCGTKDTVIIEGTKKEHNIEIDAAIQPTCTKIGITEGSHCSVCGEVIKKQEEIPATGHKEVLDEAVASTCIKAGKTEGSHCSVCGQVIKPQGEISITGHSWDNGSVTKEPTANSEGEKTYTCTVCKITKTEKIPKLTVAEKKDQKIKVTTSKKISLKSVKKKSQFFKLSAKSTSGNKVKYKLIKGNKNIKFTASSGKVTVKKGTKKGTYKIKVKMTVSGNDEYKQSSVTKTITIKVK